MAPRPVIYKIQDDSGYARPFENAHRWAAYFPGTDLLVTDMGVRRTGPPGDWATKAPPVDSVQGPGTLIVAMNDTLTHVVIQFTDPEWWIHLTPDEARNVARLLNGKADELEADQRAAGSN
jgi:hypothetical protein